jgi:hypothetical protein
MFTWFLLLRAIHITVVAFFYFVCWAFMFWTDTKGYFRYYSKVRFTLKSLLSILYFVDFSELHSVSEVSSFHIWVSALLVLLDIAEMWSRSYRTLGFKEFKKNFGKAAYFFI